LMPTTLRSKADLTKIDTIVNAVVDAVQTGDISEERLNESVRRILTLKEKRGVLNFDPSARTAEKAEKQSDLASTVTWNARLQQQR